MSTKLQGVFPRHKTRPVRVGNLTIGGDAPVIVQSMCDTDTRDVEATCEQIARLMDAGCDLVWPYRTKRRPKRSRRSRSGRCCRWSRTSTSTTSWLSRPVNTVMGGVLADAEALLAARLERVAPDDIACQPPPNPLYLQLGARHHG